MSTFDPDAFMQSTIDAPMETEYKLCPAGEYKNTFIDDFDSKAFDLKEGVSKKSGKDYSFLQFSIPFIINDPAAQAAIGREKVVVFKQLNIDRTQDGAIDLGTNKNVELGRIRDAAGQNTAGAWGPAQLRGSGPFVVTVVHESGKRDDGSEWKQARIGKVTRQV